MPGRIPPTAAPRPASTVASADPAAAQRTDLGELKFDSLTPTGARLMRASRYWLSEQGKHTNYPRPRMCAMNASKVFDLSGITRYDEEGVRAMIADVGKRGGAVTRMPTDKAAFIARLNGINGGHLPAGTLVAGENVKSNKPGDQ